MGLWDQFVAEKSSGLLPGAIPMSQDLGRRGDWEFVRVPLETGAEAPDLVATAVSELGVPAIGGYVADSDAAAVYFAEPSGRSGSLAINTSYDDSDDEHTEQWLDPDAHRAAAEALCAWAATATEARPSSEQIVEALARLEDERLGRELGGRHIVFAEEGLRAVFDVLGFPSLDDVVFGVGAT